MPDRQPEKQHPEQQPMRNPSARRPDILSSLDPRAKLVCAGFLGVLVWQAATPVLVCYALFVASLFAISHNINASHLPMLRSYLWFVILWAAIKLCIDAAGLTPAAQLLFPQHAAFADRIQLALPAAGVFALRLLILIGIGLLLTLSGSSRSLGLALSWFLRPVLGKRAWHMALSLSLMIHFLPLIQQTTAQVRHAIRLRNPACSKLRCWLLLPQATLRVMSQKTWTQTVAVAARGLDSPEAWKPQFPPQPFGWLACAVVLSIAAVPFWIDKI
ncbi:hypothetical protein [Oleidesulfovibrio sp.]|uniref:hypothetical protein n=1 Tax=Oleidesulfovibrio sp. TaxID=2909707 RepID=UPI003A83A832